jgi:hypothetical protein
MSHSPKSAQNWYGIELYCLLKEGIDTKIASNNLVRESIIIDTMSTFPKTLCSVMSF